MAAYTSLFNEKRLKGGWLAPMAGVTDRPFRGLCLEQGCARTFTEMVSALQIIQCGPKHHSLERLLYVLPGECPGLQLFGSDPDAMAEAARLVDLAPYSSIDINMGCPARKITANGEGAALMRDPVTAARMVRAVVSAANGKPVSVKMRAGWDETSRNAVDFAREMEQAGAAWVTVHGRTRAQQYSGRADLRIISEVKAALRIPVIGNGDVTGGESALAMLRATDCDAVMVGRGAMGNPWVFADICSALEGRPFTPPSAINRLDMAARHARVLVEEKGERLGVPQMRKHVAWYVHGLRGGAALRQAVNHAPGLEDLLQLLYEFRGALEQ